MSSRNRHGSPSAGDWARIAVPVVVVAALLVVAWRAGYFDLKDPAKLTAAANRVEDTPWLGPIFSAVYVVVAALAAPVSPLAYAAGAVFAAPASAGPFDSWAAPCSASCEERSMSG